MKKNEPNNEPSNVIILFNKKRLGDRLYYIGDLKQLERKLF
jgi:hypothetical protein